MLSLNPVHDPADAGVCACVDAHAGAAAVIDWAAWASRRLGRALTLLHALEPSRAAVAGADYSGAIGWDAQPALLGRLAELDAERAALAQQAARQMLAAARARAHAAGAHDGGLLLQHGELVDVVQAAEPRTRLFVLGEHHRDPQPVRRHLDHRLEQVLRSVGCPVLVSTGAPFVEPGRFVVAFDGSAMAQRVVERVTGCALLRGLAAELVHVGEDTADARAALETAAGKMQAAGFVTTATRLDGQPHEQLPVHVKSAQATLLVMGAYGHSRLRQWLLGSTTTALLRVSEVPVLVLR